MGETKVRYRVVRIADKTDDQKTAADIQNSSALSVTQEDLQEFVLSQIKRIIFGNLPGKWSDDFESAGILSLAEIPIGMTEEQHRLLPSSNHWIDQDSYDEVLRSGTKVSSIITWDSPLKTRKIREETFTRTGGLVTQIVTSNYNGSGILHEMLFEFLTRTGGRVVNIARARVLF